MDASASSSSGKEKAVVSFLRKPRILLAACGSISAVKFGDLCSLFAEWAEVNAVVTKSYLRFIDGQTFPKNTQVFSDKHEMFHWGKLGDSVLHIELNKWADIMVIAPLSANTLAKIAGGLCDNLLTCIVRAWDYRKPFFVAPSMNSFMWDNTFTEQHCITLEDLGAILIRPQKPNIDGEEAEYEHSLMEEPSNICSNVRVSYKQYLEKRVCRGEV
ncbi:probable phosphopantothenoylcysteine decarboxylase [Cajanus cajan]|uniref:phosphopantothenoylcysteine decarboxylase n=1 Tax=Cajanus cajan TaxID=3821 RepID=A0A151TB61_CAJCA|nr:probable phosphopantothenoylcysteine decarboxylase [Cajanus cajan]KYP64266.1 putative phosphopantothenoylcysteine decarboxylase [Cajanus cajan]